MRNLKGHMAYHNPNLLELSPIKRYIDPYLCKKSNSCRMLKFEIDIQISLYECMLILKHEITKYKVSRK